MGIECFYLHQEKKNPILMTSDFDPLTNQSKKEMINILYVQSIRMKPCMNCPLSLLKQCFFTLLPWIGITSKFIHWLVNKSTIHLWRIKDCADTFMEVMVRQKVIFDIVEMREMDDILVQECMKTRWMDLYPQDDTGNDSDLQLLWSSLHVCMNNWCDDKNIFTRVREMAGR